MTADAIHGEVTLQVQLKPTAGRLTMDIPLQTRGSNVNPDALPAMRLKQLSLVSQPTELSTSFAIGAWARDVDLMCSVA